MQKLFKKNHNRIGILGGTFDPPHIGHLHISKIALKKLRLDAIIWVIAKHNPLKQKPFLSTKTRINLSKDMTKSQKKIFVKYLDDKIKSRNTFDLLNFLKKKNKKIKLFFLIGADNLINFHKWKKSKLISSICNILVFDRNGYKTKSLKSLSYKKYSKKGIEFIKFKKVNISSSQLRKI